MFLDRSINKQWVKLHSPRFLFHSIKKCLFHRWIQSFSWWNSCHLPGLLQVIIGKWSPEQGKNYIFYHYSYPIYPQLQLGSVHPKDVLVVFGMVVTGTNPLLGVSKDSADLTPTRGFPEMLGSILVGGSESFKHWLVVWNMNFMTFHILGIINPTHKLIFHIFQRGRLNHQPV